MKKFTESQLKAIDEIATAGTSNGKTKEVVKQELFNHMNYADTEKLKPKR